MNKIIKAIKNPFKLCEWILRRCSSLVSNDEIYLKWYYYFNMGTFPNLSAPQTYNEKLQWLKLFYHNPRFTMMVDKIRVKNIVEEIIDEEHIIKTLGIWKRPEDIDWDSLPNKFFS